MAAAPGGTTYLGSAAEPPPFSEPAPVSVPLAQAAGTRGYGPDPGLVPDGGCHGDYGP